MTFKTRKESPGSYVRYHGKDEVIVKYYDHLKGWIASSTWDRSLLTDPVPTKREAVLNADHMLLEVSK